MSTKFEKMAAKWNAHARASGSGPSAAMSTPFVRAWQYNGSAPFDEIVEWCLNHLGREFYWEWETIYFLRPEHYTLFLLRWS